MLLDKRSSLMNYHAIVLTVNISYLISTKSCYEAISMKHKILVFNSVVEISGEKPHEISP